MSYEEEHTCVSYEEEDTCAFTRSETRTYEEEDTCVSYEEEDTCAFTRSETRTRYLARCSSSVSELGCDSLSCWATLLGHVPCRIRRF